MGISSCQSISRFRSVYISRFPDISTIKHNLNTMYDFAKNIGKDDEDLMDAFYDAFDLLEDTNNDDVYADIFKVEEVLV